MSKYIRKKFLQLNTDDNELKDGIIDIVCEHTIMPRNDVKLNIDLHRWGCDSLAKAEILCDIERKFDIKIDDNKIRDIWTINELYNIVCSIVHKQEEELLWARIKMTTIDR